MVRSTVLLILTVMAMLIATQSPADATPPTEVAGEWNYITTLAGPPKVAGCNTFLTITEFDTFTGTIEGVSDFETSGGTVVAHCDGSFSFRGVSHFDEVTVDGRVGSMEIRVNGRLASGATTWTGRWVIQNAAGGLAGLHGQGTWEGPGAGGPGLPGVLTYEGHVHFHP